MRVELEFKNGNKQEIKNVHKTFSGTAVILITVSDKIEQIQYYTIDRYRNH